MARAKIKTENGTDITIEGSADDIASILGLFKDKKVVREHSNRDTPSAERPKRKTLPSAANQIVILRESKFFDKGKTLAEIKSALDQQGSIYPVTTLSGIVLELVRKRLLGRIKQNNVWAYVKR